MLEIFGKQNRDKEGKEKGRTGGDRGRSTWSLDTEALCANCGRLCFVGRSLAGGSGGLNSSFFQCGQTS